ncbi:MAG: glycosyltransferase family 39 protein [Chitinispirillaceae bacterium]|nr:glycosyltransferase family 39 protein [Chitinispirillaceae bacterium]
MKNNGRIVQAAMIATLVLIALGLGYYKLADHSVWFDEALTAYHLRCNSISGLVASLERFESHPPLYFIIERYTCRLAGSSEYGLRFLSPLFGALSAILFYLIFVTFQSRTTAFIGTLLYVTSSYHIEVIRWPRPYALLCLLSLLFLLTVLSLVKRYSKVKTAGGIVLIFALGCTHYYAFFWVGTVLLSGFIFIPKEKKMFAAWSVLFASTVIAGALMAPMFVKQLALQTGGSKEYLIAQWAIGIPFVVFKALLGSALPKYHSLSQITPAVAAALLFAAFYFGVAAMSVLQKLRNGTISRAELLVITSFSGTFFVHSLLGWKFPTVHPMYMHHFLVLLFGLMAGNCLVRGKRMFLLFLTGMAVVNCVGFVKIYNVKNQIYPPYRSVSRAIDSLSGTHDGVYVIADPMSSFPLAYYLKPAKTIFCGDLASANGRKLSEPLRVFSNSIITVNPLVGSPALNEPSFFNTLPASVHSGFMVLSGYYNTPWKDVLSRFSNVSFLLEKTYPSQKGPLLLYRWSRK